RRDAWSQLAFRRHLVANPAAESTDRSELHRIRTHGRYHRRHEPLAERPIQRTSVHSSRRDLGSKLLDQAFRLLHTFDHVRDVSKYLMNGSGQSMRWAA